MRLTTHYHHTRYEENGSEGKFSLRMPRRKSSVFKPPVLIQFQVTADTTCLAQITASLLRVCAIAGAFYALAPPWAPLRYVDVVAALVRAMLVPAVGQV